MSAAEAQKTDPESALVGSVIARKFRLVRLLGVGGMGSVYEAQDLLLGRRVALKLMKREIASSDALVQRFVREARAADSIQHKNIVRVLDLASDDDTGQFYIVQELLSGESLADRLERERALSAKDAVEIMGPVLDALAAAHERGIVHRDVKPENVFLHREGDAIVPKLIDFGISKVLQSEDGSGLSKTQTGTALGTPYYMSPEQVRGDSSIDHRADQWSAGVMLFELLTGRRPFQSENYNLLILKIMTDRAPRADEVSISVPAAVATVIARSLEPDRAQRFASTRELRAALDQAMQETPSERLVQVARSDSHGGVRDDAPTMDAESALASSSLRPAASDVPSGTVAIPLKVESRAVAPTLIATSDPSIETPAKKPAKSVLLLGAALAAAVSVAAVVAASRPAATIVPESGRTARTTETQPESPTRAQSEDAGQAIAATNSAGTATPDPLVARNAAESTPTRTTSPTVAQTARARGRTVSVRAPTTSAPTESPTQAPTQSPTQSPTAQRPATPDPPATPQRPVGFVPVTSY